MDNRDIFVSRDELYAMVWATPMQRLAKDFGLSDVALAKTCKKLLLGQEGGRTNRENHAATTQRCQAKEWRLPISEVGAKTGHPTERDHSWFDRTSDVAAERVIRVGVPR
jgi:hypothetical protein